MAIITITPDNFEKEVLQADKPVLVDFWASWCGPCRALSPLVDEVAQETDKAKVCKLNVDECGELASRYGVMSIPTLVVFENGAEIKRSVGSVPKSRIYDLLGI